MDEANDVYMNILYLCALLCSVESTCELMGEVTCTHEHFVPLCSVVVWCIRVV